MHSRVVMEQHTKHLHNQIGGDIKSQQSVHRPNVTPQKCMYSYIKWYKKKRNMERKATSRCTYVPSMHILRALCCMVSFFPSHLYTFVGVRGAFERKKATSNRNIPEKYCKLPLVEVN